MAPCQVGKPPANRSRDCRLHAEAATRANPDNEDVSRENLERLQRGVDAFNARDLQTFFDCFHPEVVHRNRTDEPDARVFRGLGELKGYASSWLDAFDDLRIEVDEWIDLEDQVIEVAELHGVGTEAGVPVHGTYVFLWKLRNGRIIEGSEHATKEEALEVVKSRQPKTAS